jgi:hypothetical protein
MNIKEKLAAQKAEREAGLTPKAAESVDKLTPLALKTGTGTKQLTPGQAKLAALRASRELSLAKPRPDLTAAPTDLVETAVSVSELSPKKLDEITPCKPAFRESVNSPPRPEQTVSLTLPEHLTESIPEGLKQEVVEKLEEKKNKNQITISDLNTEQLEAVTYSSNLQPFCLVGSAGSGKTTTTRIISTTLWEAGTIGELTEGTRFLPDGAPAIVFVSFTNQAVYNIREAVPEEFKSNCLTIHKLLEYAPVFYEIPDGQGGMKKTMRYEPGRTAGNPIRGIRVCVVEESGNIPVELFDRLSSALPFDTVYIFLGDLNQIPPVFGDAILGFKLLELPVVELKQSYRTDTDSPIRKLAYRILEGRPIPDKEIATFHVSGQLELVRFKDRVEPEEAVVQMGKHLQGLLRKGEFNPTEDVILTPYKVKFGTIELNRYIAQARTELLGEFTYEVIVGFNKIYFAVGDIIYFEKTKWEIVDIQKNHSYSGKSPQPPSKTLNRWGINTNSDEYAKLKHAQDSEDLEALFNALAKTDQSNEVALRQASHILTLRDCAGEKPDVAIGDVGDLTSIYFAYALTVHKALGSEWKRVFILLHHSQGKMINREILYTAETRARDFCRIYFYGETPEKKNGSAFQAGIINQAIPGTGLAAKLEYFRRKLKAQAIKLQAEMARKSGEKLDITEIKNASAVELIKFVRKGKDAQMELETNEDETTEEGEENV